ncbi:MAG: glycosyltransferase family 2 protein [Neomegalonema sp.]|nr:glycosyltransferase family 2 protein [Neomegalonema sp.]
MPTDLPAASLTASQTHPQTIPPLPLSCYIRTLNEERMIGAVIRAAQQIADEVILVDSGSSDATLAIAAALGARVIEQPWLGNGSQKRVGEAACRHDWVLDLDGDEIVTPALADEIRALFADGGPEQSVYALQLVTAPPIGEPWWTFARSPRNKLYDRRAHQIPDHKAWDQLELPKGLRPPLLDAALLHYSFRDFEQYMAKWNRVSTVRAREAGLKSRFSCVLRILFALPFYFLKHYLGRGLFRAGIYGFAISMGAAFGRWMRDVKMYETHRRKSGEDRRPPSA